MAAALLVVPPLLVALARAGRRPGLGRDATAVAAALALALAAVLALVRCTAGVVAGLAG